MLQSNKSIVLLLILVIMSSSLPQKKPLSHSLKSQIHLNKPYKTIPQKFFAAEIHYSRIPHQYWQHRLQMIKAMGCNALSVYVMWNFHEIEKGQFDYQTGERNLIGFLQLAKKYNFIVLIRPGPYVCAEWDFGGIPVRLLAEKNLKIRQNNQLFINQVKVYFTSLKPIITKFSANNDGPIILLQIQNEYASFGSDMSYINALRQIWHDLDVDVEHYYVDVYDKIAINHWEDANIGLNDAIKEQYWVKAREIEPKGYLFGGEIYSGWLTHWGQKWQGKTLEKFTEEFSFLMKNNHSFSMYMAHGGTNFGLWAGANFYRNESFDYRGHVTSYDYEAPINQQGSPNDKFYVFRNLSKTYATWQIPDIPKKIQMIKIKPFIVSAFADLMQNLPQPIITQTEQLISFQDSRLKMWNQGFVLYETHLSKGNYELTLTVHDFALVYLNDQFLQQLDRSQSTSHHLKITVSHENSVLRILVQAMGHINFSRSMSDDFKGLIRFNVTFTLLNHENLEILWNVYKIPINEEMMKWNKKSTKNSFPRLFRNNLILQQTGDTYLNMEKWKKGYIFVNGHNLGRYWNIGPQQKLFLPGVWLKKGVNQIVVMDILQGSGKFIQGDLTLEILSQQNNKNNLISWPDILLNSVLDK